MGLVCNSGPLIALARIDRLDFLPSLYGTVLVPPAVYLEITRDKSLVGADALAKAEWLKVEAVSDIKQVGRLLSSLDTGESEAIVLAHELQATLALDERRGRKVAQGFFIPLTGTAGILLAAKNRGLIPAVTPLLESLIEKGIRISPRLYKEVKLRAGEP